MAWQPEHGPEIDQAQAASAGTQAGAFLTSAVHAEVNGATVDPVQVLMDPHSPDHAVYAVTAVSGPIRCYVATAWGKAGQVSGKQIVSHLSLDEARQAARDVVQKHLSGQGSPRTYTVIGNYTGDAAG